MKLSTGYILNGVYYEKMPPLEDLKDRRSATDKQHEHDRQRDDHAWELIQPYVNDKPNPAFIEQYPVEAKQYGFTD